MSALIAALLLMLMPPLDPPTLESLKRLGEFKVTAEGEPLESFPSGRPAVYFEWAAGYKVNDQWAERTASGHSGRPVTMVTPRGRLDASFAALRLYLPVTTSRSYSRRDAEGAPDVIREQLRSDARPILVEDIVLEANKTYYAKVDTEGYWLPPDRDGGKPSRRFKAVLAISDLPFENGKPQRPLTPAYQSLSY